MFVLAKKKIKNIDLVRINYRRMRKIFLHIRYGRFYRALKLANYYNPFYWLLVKNPIYVKKLYRRNFNSVLQKDLPNLSREFSKKYINVVLVTRGGNSFPGSSFFIRLLSPLSSSPAIKKIRVKIATPGRNLVPEGTDVVIVQRTAFDNKKLATRFYKIIQNSKIRLIIDTDDAFGHISETHPEYYVQSKRVEAYEYLLEVSDQIWTSTGTLIHDQYNYKSAIVPNTLDKGLWTSATKAPSRGLDDSPIEIIYMGTPTHDKDFDMILPALDELYGLYPGSFRLSVIGVSQDMPERDWIKKLYTPRFGSLYPTFVKWFVKQGPFDIGLAPLENTKFNRGKSDIKCLDYFAIGALPVVSSVVAYQNNDLNDIIVKLENTKTAWVKYFSEILNNRSKFRKNNVKTISKGQKYLWKKRSSEIASETIYSRIKNLLEH